MFLLDTNVISELRKQRPHGAVISWYFSTPLSELALPSIAFYELQAGVEIIREQDPKKATDIETWIDEISQQAVVLPLDHRAARETARLMVGKTPNLFEDAMIAAIARVHQCTVATRNSKDFLSFRVPLFNPFHYERVEFEG